MGYILDKILGPAEVLQIIPELENDQEIREIGPGQYQVYSGLQGLRDTCIQGLWNPGPVCTRQMIGGDPGPFRSIKCGKSDIEYFMSTYSVGQQHVIELPGGLYRIESSLSDLVLMTKTHPVLCMTWVGCQDWTWTVRIRDTELQVYNNNIWMIKYGS